MASADNSAECNFDEGSDDEFVDAVFDLKITATAADSELSRHLDDTKIAVNLFLSNEFCKAKTMMKKDIETSLYHSIGYVTMQFLEALMTFETKDINEAMATIKDVNTRFQKCRRKETLGTTIGKALGISNTAELTEEELHAELVFAELNLFRAALTFIQDENLISFIKGAWKIRQCYQMYNYCNKLLGKMDWRKDEILQHFAGGVFMGCGSFNVYMSLLPPRIISLLEWVGFTCNKTKGFEQLMNGYEVENLRSGLCTLFILGYHLFAAPHLGTHDEDLEKSEEILNCMLKQYPQGVYFLLFKGRFELIKGNFSEASDWLTRGSKAQEEWKQFSHICYWELMWCNALMMDWKKAFENADILRKESKWSKSVYTYLCAVFLIMQKDGKKETDEKIDNFMREIDGLRQRIAGKSIPMEKFVARKARKYFEQGRRLVLPAHEMMYVWNTLHLTAGNPEIRKKHIALIDAERDQLEKLKLENETKEANNNTKESKSKSKDSGKGFYYFDDYCFLQLLKGVCLLAADQPLQAELCLSDVKENSKGVKKDHYVAPFALVELAWMFIEQQRYEDAKTALKTIRQDFKHYSHESKLHFRMHAAQTRLNAIVSESGGKAKGVSTGSNKNSQTSLDSNGVKF